MMRTEAVGSIKLMHLPFTSHVVIVGGSTVYMTHGTLGAGIVPRFIMITHAGLLRNLYARCDAAPGGADTLIFTLMLNGVATALTCTITGVAVLTSDDIVNTVAVVPGDYVCMRVVASGGAPNTTPSASCEEWSSV